MKYIFYDIENDVKTYVESNIFESHINSIQTNEVLFFDSKDFHNYHRKNADEVIAFSFLKENKILGYCYLGMKTIDNKVMLLLPYSSPFSDVYFSLKLDIIDKVKCFKALIKIANYYNADIKFSLPPDIYNQNLFVNMSMLIDEGFNLFYSHLNNYYDLRNLLSMEEFVSNRTHSYRKNLKRAELSRLNCIINQETTLKAAYDVIELNRKQKKYPLALLFEQIKDISIMRNSITDAFVVGDETNDMAAAIVFRVSSKVVQVVYWGALDEYSSFRPMEYLAYKIVEHYKKLGYDFIDIGPSTVDDKISYGLLKFKQNIGCKTNFKPVFYFKIGSVKDGN